MVDGAPVLAGFIGIAMGLHLTVGLETSVGDCASDWVGGVGVSMEESIGLRLAQEVVENRVRSEGCSQGDQASGQQFCICCDIRVLMYIIVNKKEEMLVRI